MFKYLLFGVLVFSCLNVQGAELNDPTRPFGYQAMIASGPSDGAGEGDYLPLKLGLDPRQFKLQGIFIAKSGNSAMLNGHRVRIGDMAQNATITGINPSHIIVESNGEKLKIELLSLMVKKAVRAAGEGK